MQQEMRYIMTVYQEGSFSKAAKSLYMTQPALSIAVKKVENEIGMALFERSSQPLKLTEAGEIYIEKIREIRRLEEELERQICDLSELGSGTLRLGGSHYLNSYILPPVLTEFVRRYPKVRLELTEEGSNELIKRMSEGALDATFLCGPPGREEFRRYPAFEDRVLLAVPAGMTMGACLKDCSLSGEDVTAKRHMEPDYPAVDLSRFADTPFILLTPGNNLRERSLRLFEAAGIRPEVRMEVEQLVTAYHLARSGMGAAFISDMLVKDGNDGVRYYKIGSDLAVRKFDLVLPKKGYVPNALRAFAGVLKEFYPAGEMTASAGNPLRKP